MEFISLVEKLRQEGAVILGTPYLVGLALLALGSVLWFIHHLIYGSRLKSQEETLKRKDEHIAKLEKKNVGIALTEQEAVADTLPSALPVATAANTPINSPLSIRFEDCFVEVVPERSPFDLDAKRRRYYILVRNVSTTETARSVTIDIESITIIPNDPDDPPARKVIMGHRLFFEDGTFEKELPPRRDQKILLLSHANVMFDHEYIRIEPSGLVFLHEGKQMSVCIKATAEGYLEETLELRGSVDDGAFKVERLLSPLYQALQEQET